METLKCVIVDDEEMASRVLKSHLTHVPDMEITQVFQSAVKAFLALEKLEVDVLFLDIQMPKMTGLSMLKMMEKPPLTVLTTAHREFALEGFELDVLDYLLKPISLERFLKTVNKVRRAKKPGLSATATQASNHIFIKANRNFVKVAFSEIVYIEALKNHVKVVTKDNMLLTLTTISDFYEKLPKTDFIRVHRSFIVNRSFIESFGTTEIALPSKVVPIGRSYKDEVRLVLDEML